MDDIDDLQDIQDFQDMAEVLVGPQRPRREKPDFMEEMTDSGGGSPPVLATPDW